MDVSTFLAVVEAEARERAAAPKPEAPDPYEAFGEEIDRHPIGAPFARAADLRRRLARQGVETD